MAASTYDADVIVRITADGPLAPPALIDIVVARLRETGADYAATVIERTFPRGITVEVFTRNRSRL
jgi:spore coat polysaccharide biosynthesis protein SpsF